MSEDKNKKNKFETSFNEESKNEGKLNDVNSDLVEENFLETNDESLQDIAKTYDNEIDLIAEANDFLKKTNSAPFDQTLGIMSQTLATIDAKMDVENSQLKKLDQLLEIKNQLSRLENVSVPTSEIIDKSEVIKKNPNKIEREIPQSSIGHSHQEISELLEKIDILERKILAIENQSNNSNKRFLKIESIVNRFEDLEIELPNLFKNLFKKRNIDPNETNLDINKSKIESQVAQTIASKDIINTADKVEDDLEDSFNETLILENTTNETLIKNNFKEDFFQKNDKRKSHYLKYTLWVFLSLCATITILVFSNNFQIINVNFNELISSVFFNGLNP